MTSRELPLHREASNRRNISIGSVSPWRRQQRGIRASPRPRDDKKNEKIRAISSSSPLGEMDNNSNNNNHSTAAVVIKNNNNHHGGSPLKSLRRRLDQFRRNNNKKQQQQQQQQQIPNEICFVPHCNSNSSSSSSLLLFLWLTECCPSDVVALVLAYSGPQTVAALSCMNRHWNQVVNREETWRVLCEELYKWKPDVDEIPKSWKDYYRHNPCVPVDYPSIERALEAAWKNYHEQRVAHADAFVVRILVRPGRYELDQPLQVPAASQHAKMMMPLPPPQITIEKLQPLHKNRPAASFGHGNRRRCRWEETEVVLQSSSSSRHNINQPLLFITNGMWTLKQIRLHHGSAGMDIWRGNAALHIEPSLAPHGDSAPSTTTTTTTTATTTWVVLEQCEVTSTSGRGIVLSSSRQQQPGSSSSSSDSNTNNTRLQLRDCVVHGCAATGIYVGHDQAAVQVVHTDVIGNGMGNHQYLRRGSLASHHYGGGGGMTGAGIARGHSGIYLERGRRVELLDSNISENSSSGIGVTHSRELFSDNNNDRLLSISGCDLIGNGSLPLDVRQDNHNHHHADNTITDPHAMAQFWEQQQIDNSNHTLHDDDHHPSLSLFSSEQQQQEQQQQHDNNSTNRLSDVAGTIPPRPRSSLEIMHLHDESDDFSSRDDDHDEDTLEEEEFEEYIGV